MGKTDTNTRDGLEGGPSRKGPAGPSAADEAFERKMEARRKRRMMELIRKFELD